MIRLPPTIIGLTPDDLNLAMQRCIERQNLRAGQIHANGPPAASRRQRMYGRVVDSRILGDRPKRPLQYRSSDASTRDPRHLARPSGTGLDGSRSPGSQALSASDDSNPVEDAEMSDLQSASIYEWGSGADALASMGRRASSVDEADRVFLANVTIRTPRTRNSRSRIDAGSDDQSSIVPASHVSAPDQRFDYARPAIEPPASPNAVERISHEALQIALNAVQYNPPSMGYFEESFVRHGSTLSSSPPDEGPPEASRILPRSRPSGDASSHRPYAVHTRSRLSMSYSIAETSPSQTSRFSNSSELDDGAEHDPNDSADEVEEQLPSRHTSTVTRSPYQRGGSLSQHLSIDTPHRLRDFSYDYPSSPPLQFRLPSFSHRSFSEDNDDLPFHSTPPECSSPQLPSPYISTSFRDTPSPVSLRSTETEYHLNASINVPQDTSFIADQCHGLNGPRVAVSSAPIAHTPTRRSIRIYHDDLSPSYQPQTPSKRETTPYNPAFTAPAQMGGNQGYRYISPISARRRRRRMLAPRRDGSSSNLALWDDVFLTEDDEDGENVSIGVEASRWMRRVLGAGRRVDERERDDLERAERGELERTPERELRMGAMGSVEIS